MTDIKSPPVALLTLELHIPGSQSLKERRHTVRSIKDSIKAHFNVSVAEFGDTDKWQKTYLAVCAVGSDGSRLEHILQAISSRIDKWNEAEILQQRIEFL